MNKEKKSNMLTDITRLQLSQTPDIFKSASALFVKKYENDEDERVVTVIRTFKSE